MKVGMEIEVSIAPNSTNRNVLSDEQYQTIPFNSVIRLLDTGAVTGLKRSLSVAGRSIIDRGTPNVRLGMPIDPEDLVIDDVEAFQGQQAFLSVENTTAAAIVYRARVLIESAVVV